MTVTIWHPRQSFASTSTSYSRRKTKTYRSSGRMCVSPSDRLFFVRPDFSSFRRYIFNRTAGATNSRSGNAGKSGRGSQNWAVVCRYTKAASCKFSNVRISIASKTRCFLDVRMIAEARLNQQYRSEEPDAIMRRAVRETFEKDRLYLFHFVCSPRPSTDLIVSFLRNVQILMNPTVCKSHVRACTSR